MEPFEKFSFRLHVTFCRSLGSIGLCVSGHNTTLIQHLRYDCAVLESPPMLSRLRTMPAHSMAQRCVTVSAQTFQLRRNERPSLTPPHSETKPDWMDRLEIV
eukprot:3805065-Amphidinium_carterae.1